MINRHKIKMILFGVAKAFDLGANLRRYRPRNRPLHIPYMYQRDDFKALESDWIAIGKDLMSAIDQYREKHGQPAEKQ